MHPGDSGKLILKATGDCRNQWYEMLNHPPRRTPSDATADSPQRHGPQQLESRGILELKGSLVKITE